MLIAGYDYPTEPLPWLRATFKVEALNGFRYLPGWARYEFGCYEAKFFDQITRRTRIVSRLIHIESGVVFGDFVDIELAKSAGKRADEVLDYGFTEMADWQRADEYATAVEAWHEIGLVLVPEYGSPVAIWDRKPGHGEDRWPGQAMLGQSAGVEMARVW